MTKKTPDMSPEAIAARIEEHRRAFPDRAIAGVTRDCEDTSRGYVVTDRQYLREVLRLARTARADERAAEPDNSEAAMRRFTPCGAIVCTGCRVCGCPALGITPKPDVSEEADRG